MVVFNKRYLFDFWWFFCGEFQPICSDICSDTYSIKNASNKSTKRNQPKQASMLARVGVC